jgi:hypothetical protein
MSQDEAVFFTFHMNVLKHMSDKPSKDYDLLGCDAS